MIAEKRAIARNSQSETNDCNEESMTDLETPYSIWNRCNRYRNQFGYTDSEQKLGSFRYWFVFQQFERLLELDILGCGLHGRRRCGSRRCAWSFSSRFSRFRDWIVVVTRQLVGVDCFDTILALDFNRRRDA